MSLNSEDKEGLNELPGQFKSKAVDEESLNSEMSVLTLKQPTFGKFILLIRRLDSLSD